MVPVRALLVVLAMVALPAQARFGKAGSSSTPPPSSGQGPGHSGNPGTSRPFLVPRWVGPGWGSGYYSGWFVPQYGYGYGYAPMAVVPPLVATQPRPSSDETELRIVAGVEAMVYAIREVGYTVGVHGQVEGDRWGLVLAAQNISVQALDGSGTYDQLQQAQVRASFAFLTGRFGRLRAEVGADAVFAPNLISVGPSAALTGTLWLGGPLALEGSLLVTPFPFWQLDYRAGLALGLGPVGLRVGWRTQLLDDRGLVDGVVHRDVFMGPYAGVALVF
jgi:hypothetical protein